MPRNEPFLGRKRSLLLVLSLDELGHEVLWGLMNGLCCHSWKHEGCSGYRRDVPETGKPQGNVLPAPIAIGSDEMFGIYRTRHLIPLTTSSKMILCI